MGNDTSGRGGSRKAVIVGAGQYRRNPKFDGPFEPWEPAAMMAEAIRRAVADTARQGNASADDIPTKIGRASCRERV